MLNYSIFVLSTLPVDVYTFKRYHKARSADLFVYGFKFFNWPIPTDNLETCIVLCWRNCHGFAYDTGAGVCQLLQHKMYSTDDEKLEGDYELFVPETASGDNGVCTREHATLEELISYIADKCKYIVHHFLNIKCIE